MMNTANIIDRYNLQNDDASELSTDEELALAQEVYDDICNERPWEWLKSTFTDVTSTTLPYIALPANFREFSQNKNGEIVVFVGNDYSEYKVIPFSSRRDYRNKSGFCYVDVVNSRLYFTLQPTSVMNIEFDYIRYAPSLTLSTEPLVTTDQFGNLIAYGMAVKFSNIEQADKASGVSSYQSENRVQYNNILSDLRLQDSNLKIAM